MTRVDADWLTSPQTVAVTSMLSGAGFQVFFVGGCVRNALMNLPVADLDLATDAHPDAVIALAKTAGLKAIPTGVAHGTVTVVSGDQPFEITTFRRDIETDGRHATVAYSDNIHEDALRRDFTMNALYCAPDGTVLDPVGGLPDLMNRRVRFINDPEERIQEDYLRILRFFRFYAGYGNPEAGIDADGLAACAAHADGLEGLARERIGQEIIKMLEASDPAPAVAAMSASGVLARVLPGAEAAPLAPLIHLEAEVGLEPDSMTRLAAIYQGDAKELLRLSKVQAKAFERLNREGRSNMAADELGYRFGADTAIRCLTIRAALLGVSVATSDLEAARNAEGQRFPVSAADLASEFEGVDLGSRLKELEAAWVASGFTLTKPELLAMP